MPTLKEETLFTCPSCKSERVLVSLFCWVRANETEDVTVDYESDVGNSAKWWCEDCNKGNFLPDEVAL